MFEKLTVAEAHNLYKKLQSAWVRADIMFEDELKPMMQELRSKFDRDAIL